MKALSFFVFCIFLFSNALQAQNDPPTPQPSEKSYELFDIEKPPAYPGGEKEMLAFLAENIQYPPLARENNIQGTVALTFVVDKDGSITGINIIKDIGGGCGKEAARVVGMMPKWKPGEANGQPVKVRYTLPIRFRLTDDEPATATPLLRPLDRGVVWEGVRIKTESVFGKKNVDPQFKIKKDKKKRRELIAALEAQFQVNIGDAEVNSLKQANDLADNIFRAQNGMVIFSKTNFQGKAERLVTDRRDCDKNFDCLNFTGSVIVPKGMTVTIFSQPGFKGDQLVLDAREEEIRISNFINIVFEGKVTTTNKALKWRESIYSIRIQAPGQ